MTVTPAPAEVRTYAVWTRTRAEVHPDRAVTVVRAAGGEAARADQEAHDLVVFGVDDVVEQYDAFLRMLDAVDGDTEQLVADLGEMGCPTTIPRAIAAHIEDERAEAAAAARVEGSYLCNL